jgi:hypothetical protein
VRGQTLAEELGVSLHTLYRDTATIQAQGAAIEGEAGIGYVLRAGFTLPPLMLGEVGALVLGARWVMEQGDPALKRGAEDSLARIGAVLPPAMRERLEQNRLLIGPLLAAPGTPCLPLIRQAIREKTMLDFAYRDGEGQETQRRIWPFALGFFERVHLLLAWCELRQELRSFRIGPSRGMAAGGAAALRAGGDRRRRLGHHRRRHGAGVMAGAFPAAACFATLPPNGNVPTHPPPRRRRAAARGTPPRPRARAAAADPLRARQWRPRGTLAHHALALRIQRLSAGPAAGGGHAGPSGTGR